MILNKSTFPWPPGMKDTRKFHKLHVEWDLEQWNHMYNPSIGTIQYTHMADMDLFTYEYTVTRSKFRVDGYSEVEYLRSGGVDRQAFVLGRYINLFIAGVSGGIGVRINISTSEVSAWRIGDNRGHWFLDNYSRWIEKSCPYWKVLVMSEVSELKVPGMDYQEVIQKIWEVDSASI